MPKGGVVYSGAKQLERKMRSLEDRVRGQSIASAVEKGMEPIAKHASRYAIRSRGGPTRGRKHLADSVHGEIVKVTPDTAKGAVSYGRKQFHGTVLEVGGRGQPAFPFLRPGLDRGKGEAEREVGKEARRLIRRIAR